MTDRLEQAGQDAIKYATALWQANIYDPPGSHHTVEDVRCKNEIDTFIQHGLGWDWEKPYAGDGSFEWCGAFAAFCWPDVKPELRKTYFASTYRLDRYATYDSAFGEKNVGTGRKYLQLNEKSLPKDVAAFGPRAGDILMIGPTGSGYGKHITLVESFDALHGTFNTLEGNGNGNGPKGYMQGVVRGKRLLGGQTWHARRLIRPSLEDLV